MGKEAWEDSPRSRIRGRIYPARSRRGTSRSTFCQKCTLPPRRKPPGSGGPGRSP